MGQYLTYTYDFTDTDEIDMTYLRNDFFQTETELYQENCLDILHDWLNEKGMYQKTLMEKHLKFPRQYLL